MTESALTPQTDLKPATQVRTRAAMWLNLLMMVAAFSYGAYSGYVAMSTQVWQYGVITGVMGALALSAAAGAWLSWRGKPATGTLITVAVMALAILTNSALLIGLGLVFFAMAVFLTATFIAPLPPTQATQWVSVLGLIVGVVALLLDVFGSRGYRTEEPVLQLLAPIIGGALALASAVVVGRQFRNYALRTKLIVTIIGTTALAITAVTFISDRFARTAFVDDVGSNLQRVADSQALAVNGLLSEQLSSLRAMSLSEVIRTRVAAENLDYLNLSEAEIRNLLTSADQVWIAEPSSNPLLSGVVNDRATEELRKFTRMFPDHTQVFVTDKYGGQIAATDRLAHYDLSQEPWWQAAFNRGIGADHISQPEFDEQGKLLGLRVLVPLYTVGQQDFMGVLGALYSLDGLETVLNRGRIGETGHVHVSLPNGSEIHLVTRPELGLQVAAARLDIDELLRPGSPYREIRLRTGAVHIASQALVASEGASSDAITSLGWRVVAHQQRSEALQPIEARGRVTLLLGSVAALAAGVFAFWLARLLTAPITQLTATAARVSGGDLTAQAPVEANDEIGALATTFNVMTTQLRESLEGLEQRVAERTKALRTTIEVSRRISTSMDRGTLATQVVEQLQSAFGYYHAHIYFFDEARQNLVMAGGTGDAGRLLLERGHRLPKGRGLVGRAAERNEVVLVPDTLRDAQWLPNPLLPETRAEVAVPIAVGAQVFGVLDVQQNVVNGLSQEDADLLQSLAYQVAIALQNAQSFERAREQAALEAQVNAIGQKIQGATSVEGALQIAARELGRALGGARTRVRLKTDEGNGNGHATTERGD